MLLKLQNKLDGMTDLFEFFFSNQWLYKSQKILDVSEKMSEEERQVFHCDMRSMVWKEYIEKYILGLQIWVLKLDSIKAEHQMDQIMRINSEFGKTYRETVRH